MRSLSAAPDWWLRRHAAAKSSSSAAVPKRNDNRVVVCGIEFGVWASTAPAKARPGIGAVGSDSGVLRAGTPAVDAVSAAPCGQFPQVVVIACVAPGGLGHKASETVELVDSAQHYSCARRPSTHQSEVALGYRPRAVVPPVGTAPWDRRRQGDVDFGRPDTDRSSMEARRLGSSGLGADGSSIAIPAPRMRPHSGSAPHRSSASGLERPGRCGASADRGRSTDAGCARPPATAMAVSCGQTARERPATVLTEWSQRPENVGSLLSTPLGKELLHTRVAVPPCVCAGHKDPRF